MKGQSIPRIVVCYRKENPLLWYINLSGLCSCRLWVGLLGLLSIQLPGLQTYYQQTQKNSQGRLS